MNAWRALLASGIAVAGLMSVTLPDSQADDERGATSEAIPEIRRIFVPAASPELWPRGNWQEMRVGELEQIESQLKALRAAAPAAGSTSLERAEYRAVFAGGSLRQGRLEWTPRASAVSDEFLPLGQFNLAIADLEWVHAAHSNTRRPVVWGTTPSKTVGLVHEHDGKIVTGNWSLRGRQLIRSTEFDLRLPTAIVSQLTLHVPHGLLVTCTAGDLAGPKPAAEPGWSVWQLHLGSRSECRLRLSPPASAAMRRPLMLSRSRTNYVVRPEVVRLVAEFDLDVYEAAATELNLALDAGLQVTAVEYGDEDSVDWQIVDGTDGREIAVVLPDPLTGPGQTLRVHGIVPLKPQEPWNIPRIRMKNAVEPESQVKVRLQPPFQAADLRIDGFRQVELTTGSTDGETLLLRQLRADASLMIIPAQQRLTGIGRSTTLVSLDEDELSLTASLALEATSGEAFDISCDIPPEWDITSVQSENDSGPSELSGWVVDSVAGTSSRLHLSFLTALGTSHPQRVQIAARRKGVPTGEILPVIALTCQELADVEAVTIMVGGEKRQPVVERLSGFEELNLADLPAPVQNLGFLKSLSAAARATAVVVRTDVAKATGTIILRPLHGAEAPLAKNGEHGIQNEAETTLPSPIEPVVVISTDADVKLSEADQGFDRYQVTAIIRGSADSEISWRLPEIAEPIVVRLNGHSAAPGIVEGRQTLRLADSGSNPDGGHVLSLEYRTPVRRGFGPYRQQLALPEFTPTVMSSRLQLFVPRALRIVEQPGELVLADRPRESVSLLGPLGRAPSAPFNPFRGADWEQLLESLTSATDTRSPASLTLPATDDRQPPNPFSGVDFDILRGESMAPLVSVELTVWNRRQAGSLAWTACLTAILSTVCLRIRGRARGRIAAALVAAGLAGAMCVFPGFPGELAGSMLAGLAIGVLLPARFCEPPRPALAAASSSVPSGSTRVFVASSAMFLFSALTFAYAVNAGESRPEQNSRNSRDGFKTPDRFDVLIPTTGRNAPQAETICYVPAGFPARMNHLLSIRQVPRYLLNSVAINAVMTRGGQTDVKARFKVYILSSDDPVTIVLSVTNVVLGGPDACLVDGRPHPILLGPEGRTLTIPLSRNSERPAPVPEPESAPDAAVPDGRPAQTSLPTAGSSSRSRPVACEIELRLHLAAELEANDSFRSRLGIPRANDTSAEFSADGGLVPLLTFETDNGFRQVIGADEATPARIADRTGPTSQLEFRWSRNVQSIQALPVELDATVAGMVDVSPSLTSATYRVGYRVLSGSVDSLVWKLPRGCTLQSVHSPDLSGYVVESANDDTRLLLLEFSAPQSGNIAVTATLLLPLPVDARECEFPMLELEDARDQTGHTILRRYQMAFRPPVDFQLEVTAASNLVIKPRNVDEFLKDWPVVGARPQQALELIRPGTLRFKFREFETELMAQTEFQGRFTGGRLEWTFRAEISPSAVPPFQYRLQIDPRLRIRNVSVQEDGAERLLRWSRVDDSLILFLNDRATRAQTLRISALMPLATPEEFELPQLSLSGSRTSSHRVTLRSEPDVRVTVLGDAAGRKPLAPPVEAAEPNRADRVIARFDIPAEGPLPRVRVEPASAIAGTASAYLLRPSGTGQELTVALQFRVHSGRIRQFELQLPNDLARRARIETIPPSQPLQLPDCDGRSQLAFVPAHPVSERFYVVIRAPVDLPTDTDWTVPDIASPLFDVSDKYLLADSEELPDLQTIDPPDWLHGLFENEPDFAQLVCYRLPTGSSNPVVHLKSSHTDLIPDSLSDARVQLGVGGDLRGQLGLWLPDHPGTELIMDWPAGCEPLAVFVDDKPRAVPAPDGDTWKLPLPSAAAPRLVWLAWKDQTVVIPGVAGKWRPRIPVPRNIAVKTGLLTIRTNPQFLARPLQAEPREEILNAALVRWQAILSAAGRRNALEEPWLARTLAGAATNAESLATPSNAALSLPLRKQLDGLRRQFERLKMPKVADAPAAAAIARGLMAINSDDSSATGSVSGQVWTQTSSSETPGEFRGSEAWLFNRRAIEFLLAIMAALIVGSIVWSGAGVWRWMQQSEPLAWISLGGFWWLALRPSALGLVLFAVAAIRFVQIRRARASEPSAPAASL
jgi:hypothetical protein